MKEVDKLSFLLNLTQKLQNYRKINDIAQFALDYLVESMECNFGEVKVIEKTNTYTRANTLSQSFSAQLVFNLDRPITPQSKSCDRDVISQVIETGKPLSIEDFPAPFRHLAIGKLAIFPIVAIDNNVIGLLSLEFPNSRNLRDNLETDLISSVCSILGAWLERAKSQENLCLLKENLEKKVRQRTAELEAANKELESFSYSVAHDLRAPIRHVNSFVGALRQKLKQGATIDDREVVDYLDIIDNSSRKMAELVDSLLTLSRIGRRKLKREKVNLQTIVKKAIASLETQINTSGHIVEWTIGTLPTVEGDSTMLQMLFNNLLANAIKFSRNSSPARIEVATSSDETIFVKDNGVGFDMAYADQLFEPFQRLHSQSEFSGTGIGLTIVQRIVQRHQGKIWAESQLGSGATFYINLKKS